MIDEKSVKLAAALNRETVNKNIKWHMTDAPQALTYANNDIMQMVYWTVYNERKIVIFKKQYRHYFDEEEWTWAEGLSLCIVTEDFRLIWENDEQSQALRDLYKNVTKQASGFYELLDDLLNN